MRLVKLEEANPTPPAGSAQPPRHHVRAWLIGLAFSPVSGTADHGEQAIWMGDARGNNLLRTPVEVGASDGRYAEVRGQGLADGAMVAVGFGRAPISAAR
jgi:hypothetical protein